MGAPNNLERVPGQTPPRMASQAASLSGGDSASAGDWRPSRYGSVTAMRTLLCPVSGVEFTPTVDAPAYPAKVIFHRRAGRRRWHESRIVPVSPEVGAAAGWGPLADPEAVSYSIPGRDGSRHTSSCVSCGIPVSVAVDGRRKVSYCSDRCRHAYYRAVRKSAPQAQVCAHCGTEFEGRRDARFCSAACRQGAYRARKG